MLLADVLVALGAAVATVAVVGVARSRSGYMQVHASTLSVVGGAMLILAAALTTGEGPLIGRSILVAAALLLTAAVSGHAVARLQFRMDQDAERERAPAQRGDGGSQTKRTRPG